ncbi:hypothetical protein [Streptococcus oricebi]|uniref:hypothetical protein n=1 Tax=Streptococcus oricebi TaxID=1547447 RepID=UPI001AE2C607|nr:hypothetical protein [Streptococcus oricebi]
MRLEISWTDKKAQQDFYYELTLSGQKLLLGVAVLSAALALSNLVRQGKKKQK